MMYRVIKALDGLFGLERASAHCDIPCGIYDPISAQLAALSVLRFLDQLAELDTGEPLSLADQAKLSRIVEQKESHAEQVKQEVRVIWGDYFKAEQLEQCPDTHELVHQIMRVASSCKQGIDRAAGVELVELANRFAENFWRTKQVPTFTAVCPYKPSVDVVYPALHDS
ncbi:MAG: superoxide dismutase, Ni [Pseudomonadota bacterium]